MKELREQTREELLATIREANEEIRRRDREEAERRHREQMLSYDPYWWVEEAAEDRAERGA